MLAVGNLCCWIYKNYWCRQINLALARAKNSPRLYSLALAIAAHSSTIRNWVVSQTKLLSLWFLQRSRSAAVVLFAHKTWKKLLIFVCNWKGKQSVSSCKFHSQITTSWASTTIDSMKQFRIIFHELICQRIFPIRLCLLLIPLLNYKFSQCSSTGNAEM